MRHRLDIEGDADKARVGPSSPTTKEDLTIELLLDIRDLLLKQSKISTEKPTPEAPKSLTEAAPR